MRYHLTPVSANVKTGPIAVSTTSADSCPTSCPFIAAGCYAKSGPLALHWRKVGDDTDKRSLSLDGFTAALSKALRKGQTWRHNQAGDLPSLAGDSTGETIDTQALEAIRTASHRKGAHGFTYTHKKTAAALAVVKANNALPGLLVNVSCDTLQEVDIHSADGLPCVVVVPMDQPSVSYTPAGRRVVVCPAQQRDDMDCSRCKACSKTSRPVIAFRAHGTGTKKLTVKLAELAQA